ncbi:MAG TPA: DUF1573 domain-containing protein [Bacteroidales bacterium]|nr:DUF1573 domain-containing protein [Bacteroidales bacterium]HOX75591.1 DUF1573 domain-containing protein [Bacteroidales bacterium]HPM86440.1 DUF1573 domain-containing protein [Bacteroidales bacterium]HQM68181.1 DUF1573 domain-containing protein [Bacteroidales bacterium]
MKKVCLIISTLTITFSMMAQPVMKLSQTEHNFGKFKEEAGRQTHEFLVTNSGTSPLVIQNIVASCGCTTPEWTKQPIPPGGKGVITAIYDPQNRPGAFNKTLSVYTNSKPEVVVLSIKGEVIPREKTMEELYIFPVGSIRFESNHLAFTNVKKTEKKIRVMQVINPSKEPVKIEFESLPAHLTLKANPETLKPGQKGIIEGTYDATKNDSWGNVSDMVKVKLNGVTQQNVFYYISANLVEDFSSLSKADLESAPVFKLASTTVDLGKIPGSTEKEVEFRFTNAGKRDLVIRHVRSTCGCTAVQQGTQGMGIKPGQSSSIKAKFNSGSYKGRVTKAIYVYTNDPKNSEVVLMLNADVEQTAQK